MTCRKLIRSLKWDVIVGVEVRKKGKSEEGKKEENEKKKDKGN